MSTDLIVILGGSLKKEGGLWRTAHFDEGDNFGTTGDTIRVIAGSYLFKEGLAGHILVSGGKGQYKNDTKTPTIASVMKKELIDLGVAPDKIEEETQSENTYQQLRALKDVVAENGWNSVGIISNRYHLPRIQAMIECGPSLGIISPIINLICAEDVLLTYAPNSWQKVIEEAYRREEMKKRIAIEQMGVKDIREGRYKFN